MQAQAQVPTPPPLPRGPRGRSLLQVLGLRLLIIQRMLVSCAHLSIGVFPPTAAAVAST